MLKQLLQLDLEYNAWANRRLLEACSHLSEGELRRDLGLSHRSLIGTLNHMFDGERFWFDCLRQNEMPLMRDIVPDRNAADLSFEEPRRDWPGVWDGSLQWLHSLDEGDFGGTLRTEVREGVPFHFTRWQLIRHVVNHSSLHRGQVVGMLRMTGKQPPNVDLTAFYVQAT